MAAPETRLDQFDNSWYNPGAGPVKRTLWYFCNALIFKSYLLPISGIKVFFLRLFGASVGKGVVIKPNVNIKYPWKLEIGNYSWIGEEVWIDNLAPVKIGAHCCISQGALLLCGNHDYSKPGFDLITREIHLEDGVWIGAKCLVCPGTRAGAQAVLAAGSVAKGTLEPAGIYQGNPAVKIKERIFKAEGN
jgi:putative colanic acid biosynthesis acetyltransferase WcaF